jgi:hypothetical protein
MNKYKFLGYFLIALFVLILVKAISFAIIAFFWIVKAMIFAVVIGGLFYLFDLIFDKKE